MRNNVVSLSEVFDKILNSKILLPDFQRDFVWERSKQSLLAASLLNKIPMGAFLTSKSNGAFKCRMVGINNYTDSTSADELLLDGQQRISTLFNIFNDIYDVYHRILNIPHLEVHDEYIFNELKSRWFLKVNGDFLGISFFKMNLDLTTREVNESIVFKKDLKTNLHGYGPILDLSKLLVYCLNNEVIPLFLLISDPRFVRAVLVNLAEKYGTHVQINFSDEELAKLREIHYPRMGFAEFKNGIIAGGLITNIKSEWLLEVESFLKYILSNDQYIIHLEDISKVSEAFNYLNRGGVQLSNFDLFCSKYSGLGIRKKTMDLASDFSDEFIKNRLVQRFDLDDTNVLRNNELNAQFSEFIVHVYSLYYFHKQHPNREDFDLHVLKSSYTLDSMPLDFLTDTEMKECQLIANQIALFIFVNFGFEGVNKIPNKLALIPIVWLLISKDIDFKNSNHVDLVCAHYYITVFSLYYDSHQNENCLKASRELIKLFNHDTDMILSYQNQIGRIFTDYLPEVLLSMKGDEYISKSVEINILNFYLCLTFKGIVDFKPARNQPRVDFKSIKEVHHLIPLFGSNQIKQSTSKIRGNKNHRLNSVLNKTLISNDANRAISSMPIANYMSQFGMIFSQIHQGHIIPDEYRNYSSMAILSPEYDPNDIEHQRLNVLYEARYNYLRSKIEATLLDWLPV